MQQIAFCVAGWHFSPEIYTQLKALPDADIFILSHRPANFLPAFMHQLFPGDNIITRPNLGYDWGCFQQFLETGLWKKYEYIFFMHDDIRLIDMGFVPACISLLNSGHAVIGNGRAFNKRDWPRTHLAYYAHSNWKPASQDFQYDIVRGSFFATTRAALEKIESFEVFWDRFQLNIGFGNNSLIASCGKMAQILGDDTFAYLSEDYRNSQYIVEFERGQEGGAWTTEKPRDPHRAFNLLFMSWYNRVCIAYTKSVIERGANRSETAWQQILRSIVQLFAGR